jgi:amidase
MKSQGAVILDPADIKTKGEFHESEFEVLLHEFKAGLDEYLSKVSSEMPVHSLQDVIDYNEWERDRVMPYFRQERMLLANEKGPLSDALYQDALLKSRTLAGKEGIDLTLAEEQLDVIMAPSGGPAWKTDLVNGDHHYGSSSSPAAVAGYPNITVPAGFIHGLPVGISFFAGAYQEPVLLKVAYAFEQASQVRKSPQFISTIE